jgi:hypothetical protein
MFTTVELSLKYKDWLNLVFGFDYKQNDNYVGGIIDSKLFSRLVGQIGIKNFALRASWGRMRGTAEWEGDPVPGQPDSARVDTKYYEIALLYYFGSTMHVGVIYQNHHMPISLTHGYDNDIKFDYYGVYLGVSTFRYFMDHWKKRGSKTLQWNFWWEGNGSLGLARGNISEEGWRRERFGYVVGNDTGHSRDILNLPDGLSLSASEQLIAGLCWGVQFDMVFLGFGAGYDGFVQVYLNNAYSSALVRHGFVVRAYCSF